MSANSQKLLVIVVIFFIRCVKAVDRLSNEEYGPKYSPTKGEVWPRPQNQTWLNEVYTYIPRQFSVKITGHTCPILANAVQRYKEAVNILYKIAKRIKRLSNSDTKDMRKENKSIRELRVLLKNPCEEHPHLDMDEKYKLTIAQTSVLTAESVWGMLRGLETAAQLFYLPDDFTEVQIRGVNIIDFPSYAHRGLLLDSARHYISVENILKTLDAMAMNKMNVFHWHIVDDQSFPYQSKKFPALSNKGAFHPTMVYTRQQIRSIIEYARYRGIRVIPEFDMPGHSGSWGISDPSLLTECYNEDGDMVSYGPLNPISDTTHKLVKGLLEEIAYLFPDKFLHFGGDEVNLNCWLSNPQIKTFMLNNNLTEISDVLELFSLEVMDYVNKTPIIWQELFDIEDASLPSEAIVQVWKLPGISKMAHILESSNLRVIFSSLWYIDDFQLSFESLYIKPPRELVRGNVSEEKLQRIIGGEVCLWGEKVDDTNLLTRTWPRASAAAEVLWSAGETISPLDIEDYNEHTEDYREHIFYKNSKYHGRVYNGKAPGKKTGVKKHIGGSKDCKDNGGDCDSLIGSKEQEDFKVYIEELRKGVGAASSVTFRRVEEHACRMRRRSVPAEPPIGPGYCLL